GVATADVYLESFRTLVGRIRMPPGSYTLLVSRQGTVIAASPPKAAEDPRARQTAERVAGRGSGFEAASAGAPGWVADAPVSGAGWTIAEFFPEAVLLEPVVRLEALLCGIAILGGAALLVLVVWGSRALTRPLTALAAATQAIAAGNFDAPV